MTLGKVVGAAHFLEAADGALELEDAVASRVKPNRLGIGGGEQFDLMFVKRVDQNQLPDIQNLDAFAALVHVALTHCTLWPRNDGRGRD